MEIKILFVDDEDILQELVEYFNGLTIDSYKIIAYSENTFEAGLERIRKDNFEIIVLDLCRGKASETAEQEGLNILKDLQSNCFIPVVFHSAVSYKIAELKSLVVGVTDKKNGVKELENEILRILSSNTVLLKDKVHRLIESEFKKYFWDVIHNERNIFLPDNVDGSLGYLILRRLANSISKDNIKHLVNDNRQSDNAYPMEFYIYPTQQNKEFEAGEIIKFENELFILLTPDCDFVERFKKGKSEGRKAEKVLMAKINPLKINKEYIKYKEGISNETTNNLKKVISNNFSERYFFLPGTPFIENSLIDFQDKKIVNYDDLNKGIRLTKLDLPFAQSMVTHFIRYYNRIGFPDIDIDLIISKL